MAGLQAMMAAGQSKGKKKPHGDWFATLSKKDAYVRLIDAYRLRAGDDVIWGGGNMHGLYAKEPPLPDFQEFTKMAAKNNMLPSWWSKEDDRKMEEMALTDKWANINSAVEKSDIIEHYDSTYPMMLRMIAEHVTGKSLNQ